jgi:hypothetical protein
MAARKLNLDQLQALSRSRHSTFPDVVRKAQRPKKQKSVNKFICKPVVEASPVPAEVVAQVQKQPEIKEKPGKQVDWDQLGRFFKENMAQKLF